MNDFEHDAAESPDINGWYIVIVLCVGQELFVVRFSLGIVEKVDQFWRDVLRSGESILFYMLEKEAGAVIH